MRTTLIYLAEWVLREAFLCVAVVSRVLRERVTRKIPVSAYLGEDEPGGSRLGGEVKNH